MKIKNNVKTILQQIIIADIKYNHPVKSVQLLTVSKTQSTSAIKKVFDSGQYNFGENYLQEALPKIIQLNHLPICWHFIGTIQSNKTKDIAHNFDWVHTVDRFKIAEKLNIYATKPINICIQVNISLEHSKSGCHPDEVLLLANKIQQLPNIKLRGLMAIPKRTDNFKDQFNEFNKMKQLFDLLNIHGFDLDILSIGMSYDFKAAIAAGGNLVRIGQAIFGART